MGKIEEDLLKQLQVQHARQEVAEAEKKAQSHGKGAVGGIVGILLLLLWKFKAVLILIVAKLKFFLVGFKFLGLGKLLMTGGSMIVSIWAYALYWGLPFAIGFVLLIFVHEAGHVIALYRYGVKASMPIFVPFVGAFVALKEMPKNVAIEAHTAIAGPILGSLGAFACLGIYYLTNQSLFLSLAYIGFIINLFNMMPILPLDGGRVVGAISPRLWLLGIVVCIFFSLFHPNIILIILVLMSIPRLIYTFRMPPGAADYYKVAPLERAMLTLLYFGLATLLGVLSYQAHSTLQGIIA